VARPRKRAKGAARTPARAAREEKSVASGPSGPGQFVTLAQLVRVRGLAGEVAANVYTDFPQRLTELGDVWLLDSAGRRRPARVKRCWLSTSRGGQAIFHFEGADSIVDAEKLVGCEVQVPLAERAPLPEGRYYVSDLVGCDVVEMNGTVAERAGVVRDVFLASGTPLLVVDSAQGELLIPLAEDVCTRIDPAARRIEVRLPDGLRELNRAGARE